MALSRALLGLALLVGMASAQTLVNTTYHSTSQFCTYTGSGWIQGTDYQTNAANDYFVCTFTGVAVYVQAQICGPPTTTCSPGNTGTFDFAIDGSTDFAQYTTPSPFTPLSTTDTNGYATLIYGASGLANTAHTITGLNTVAGRWLWFQDLIVTSVAGTSAAPSSSVSATTSASAAVPVVVDPSTAQTTSTTSSSSSSSQSSSADQSSSAGNGSAVSDNSGSNGNGGSSSHVGAIVGGVVGGVVGLALIALLLFCLARRRRRNNSTFSDPGTPDAWAGGRYEKTGESAEGAENDAHEMTYQNAPLAPPVIQIAPMYGGAPAATTAATEEAKLPYANDEPSDASSGDAIEGGAQQQHAVKRKPVPTSSTVPQQS